MSLNSPLGSNSHAPPGAAPASTATVAQAVTAAISNETVQLYLEAFGRGPTNARAFVQPQFAVCVLRDVFTTVERTLIEKGGVDQVEAARRKINEALDDDYIAIVERQTGRTVQNHLAHLRAPANLVVHVFLFDDL